MQSKAYLYLIRLLSSRDYSEFKLREKLREKQYPATEIDEAIAEIKAKNYLREDNYAEARAKAFMNKGYSPDYIKQKLAQEHVSVDEDFIQNIYSENRNDSDEQIRSLVEKKLRGRKLDSYEQEVKVIRFILSKGHQIGAIKKILKEYKTSYSQSSYNDLE
jgi:regulatory protein